MGLSAAITALAPLLRARSALPAKPERAATEVPVKEATAAMAAFWGATGRTGRA